MKRLPFWLAALVLSGAIAAAQQRFTYVDLIHRLTDLEYLATVPAPGARGAQWSSYDRRSRYDASAGKYVGSNKRSPHWNRFYRPLR